MSPRSAPSAPLLDDSVTAACSPPAAAVRQAQAQTLVPVAAITMFERLALDPNVDVGKLERLIQMQERILAREAQMAFNLAFAEMAPEIPEIDEKGRILNKQGEIQSHYAKNEDIQQTIKPILAKHGFSIGFRTEWPTEKRVKVVGILTHRDGHTRESEFLSEADPSGSKNAIQGLGSAISYGHRYTTVDLLNITSREPRAVDDDGRGTDRIGKPDLPAPEGFDAWQANIEAVCGNGYRAFNEAWEQSKPQFRNHLIKLDRGAVARLKAKAREVGR